MEGRLIVRIVCGKEVGTAFYVAPDLLLTAYHTVACYSDDAENIVKDSTDGDLHFEVIRNIEEFDISILKVSARSEKDFYGLQAHHLSNHGKTKSARIQKRNVFSTDKNEM